MRQLENLKRHLKMGSVYRRTDLAKWSKSIDRHLIALIEEGTLRKLSQGLYYYPKKSTFGPTPPEDREVIRGFLKDRRFLITSPNTYNNLGVGTTQLHNLKVVFNHKRHGEITLGNRKFLFQQKHYFPSTLTKEFLLVDLVNNIEKLAEDNTSILDKALRKAQEMDAAKMISTVEKYGNLRTKKLFSSILNSSVLRHAG